MSGYMIIVEMSLLPYSLAIHPVTLARVPVIWGSTLISKATPACTHQSGPNGQHRAPLRPEKPLF